MPDLAMELAHLELADRHIAQAKSNIAAWKARVADDTALAAGIAAGYLRTLEEVLVAFESHRELIRQAIRVD